MYDLKEKRYLDAWVDRATRHIDLIASWERLVDIYNQLSFVDSLTDQVRIEEFGCVIRETNKFLSRMRKSLSEVRSIEDAIAVLTSSYYPGRNVTVDTRQAIAFQKLKQQWITQGVAELQAAIDMINETEDENE